MARILLSLPDIFIFSTNITVRIDDLNYGNHLSNDCYLKYMQEARMQFLAHYNLNEMDIGGTSVIMGDTAIVFKHECFYADVLKIEVSAQNFGSRSFDLFYKFTKNNGKTLVCEAKTGMVCFDYNIRKTTVVPQSFIDLVSG
jgi:acyl-CoA thioester hydrolase